MQTVQARGLENLKRCWNCRAFEVPVLSATTGLQYCPSCGATIGRAFTPDRAAVDERIRKCIEEYAAACERK